MDRLKMMPDPNRQNLASQVCRYFYTAGSTLLSYYLSTD